MHFQYQSSALIMRITLLFLLCISKSIFNCTNQSLLDDQIKNDNHLQSETKKKETLDFFEESENATDKVLLTHTSISRNITMNYKDIDCNYNLEGESSIFYNCQALVQVQSSPSRRTRVESMVPTAHHHHHHHHRKLFKFLIAMYIQSRVKRFCLIL